MSDPNTQDFPAAEPIVVEPDPNQESTPPEESDPSGQSETPTEGGGGLSSLFEKHGHPLPESFEPAQTPPPVAEDISHPETQHEFPVSEVPTLTPAISDDEVTRLAREVVAGKWGNGEDRKSRLSVSGFDYDTIQARVNEILDAGSADYRTYTVQPGDTLKGIADRIVYRHGWKALYEKNLGVVGNDPNAVVAGQILSL